MTRDEINSGKTAAIVSYILIIGVLIALSINSESKNKFAAFHIRQGLGLTVSFIVLGVSISYFENFMIAMSMWIFISVLAIYGIFTAAMGQITPIPILGKLFQKVFASI